MTIISPPAYQQAGSYSARTDRLSVFTGLLGYHGNSADEASLRTRGGVRPSYQQQQLAVTAQLTPNMTVNLGMGIGYVQNKDLANYGAYTVVNDAPIVLPIAASSGSQYRKDTVVVQVLDAETLGAVNSASAVVVQGPYAASAGATTRGTIPPNSIVIADIAVDAGVTSITSGKITDARQFQVAAGGILPVTSATIPDHPAPGQAAYVTDTGALLIGTSTGTWRTVLPGTTLSAAYEDTTSRTTTSTTLTTLAGGFTGTLVVPPSGVVKVSLTTLQRNSASGNTFTSFRAAGSVSGTAFTETLTGAIGVTGSNNSTGMIVRRLSGLTPGETLTVTPYHMVNAGTGTYDYRYIMLEGLPS